MRDLNEAELIILDGLGKVGAATAIDLAVRLRDLPQKIEPKLKEFQGKGLVEVTPFAGQYETAIYRVSDKGRRLLHLLHALTEPTSVPVPALPDERCPS